MTRNFKKNLGEHIKNCFKTVTTLRAAPHLVSDTICAKMSENLLLVCSDVGKRDCIVATICVRKTHQYVFVHISFIPTSVLVHNLEFEVVRVCLVELPQEC
jgi:hypothetical protein